MSHFDQLAQNWDNDPKKVERAKIIANEITALIQTNKNTNAFEFGCGTGLLSYQMKDAFKSITLADNSKGMIQVVREKVQKEQLTHFKPMLIDLLKENTDIEDQDVIYTLMTLHHIPDLQQILKTFHKMLNTGGYLCIADLVAENGSFHSHLSNFDGHNGFDKDELSQTLLTIGFKTVYYKICLDIEKKVGEELTKFPLFLMIAEK